MGYNIRCGNLKKKYDVTMVLLTYEQPMEMIFLTLASALEQRNVELQIVISDDNSSVNYMKESIDYLEKRGFKDYKVLVHNKNQGTVKNYRDAIAVSDGRYIKVFGAGDCFCDENSLYLWLLHIRRENSQLSFCDAVYYRKINKEYECIGEVAHPQKPEVYLRRQSIQKKYYLLYNDIFLGAALLISKELVEKYVNLMVGRIKYAEDNIYRIMILDGVKCSYFAYNAIYYEWGTGISTQAGAEFKKALDKDWKETSSYICERCKNNLLENMIRCYYWPKADKKFFLDRVYNKAAYLSVNLYKKRNMGKKRITSKVNLEYLYHLRYLIN